MDLRDIALTLFVVGVIPFALRRPDFAIYLWSWIGYMNPHRLTWGFAFYAPFAQVAALVLFASMAINQKALRFPRSIIYPFWGMLIVWMIISTVFAIFPDWAVVQLIKVLKIQLVVILTLFALYTRTHIIGLIWVIVGSIGFYTVKGGIFTVVNGGVSRVWGPPGGYIAENNALAVAGLMILPLMWFLASITPSRWIRYAMWFGMLCTSFSIAGSQSRGALVASLAVGLFMVLKSRAKLVSMVIVLFMGTMLFTFMPQSWHDRMATIETYEQDTSAQGRLNAWAYSINVASDRLTGAGFESWSPQTFAQWAPNPNSVHAAHSIYFSFLGDHGWPGLTLFLMIGLLTWRSTKNIQRMARGSPELEWAGTLARMLQISLIAYASGGAFLSLAYFDLPWHFVAVVIIVENLCRNHVPEKDGRTASAPSTAKPTGPRPIGGMRPVTRGVSGRAARNA